MRFLILFISWFFLLNVNAFACSGSCLLCHEKLNLEKPVEHKIIKQCIKCHSSGCGENSLFEDKQSDTSCGSDCFDCHKTFPQDEVHLKIAKCVKCHKKLDLMK